MKKTIICIALLVATIGLAIGHMVWHDDDYVASRIEEMTDRHFVDGNDIVAITNIHYDEEVRFWIIDCIRSSNVFSDGTTVTYVNNISFSEIWCKNANTLLDVYHDFNEMELVEF